MNYQIYQNEFIKIHHYQLDVLSTNMYVMIKNNVALIIDPFVSESLLELLHQNDISKVTILLTHEHFDHISGVNWLRDFFECKLICTKQCGINIENPSKNLSYFSSTILINLPPQEKINAEKIFPPTYTCYADETFESTKNFRWEDLYLTCVPTPGHSEGSQCITLQDNNKKSPAIIFTGDSLIYNEKIITRLPGGNKNDYKTITLPFLQSLSPDTIIMPGHGIYGKLSIF